SGDFSFTVQVRDAQGVSNSRDFSLAVASSLVITTPSALPSASVGGQYTVTLAASGGNMPYTWRVANGSSLPSGLSLNPSTGVLSGAPAQSGTFSFGIEASDAQDVVATRTFTLSVVDQ